MKCLTDGLLLALEEGQRHGVVLSPEVMEDYHAALTALVAERDALKRRVAELEAHPLADRDLREQMSAMMSWMTHITDMILVHGLQADHAKIELSRRIDRAIVAATNCAMRKGGGA